MQHPTTDSVPVSAVSIPADNWQGLPYWLQFGLGFLLIGVSASMVASQLRAAFPPPADPNSRRALHFLYPMFFGGLFASLVPFALPGFGYDQRWIFGLVAPYLWAPLYDMLKKRYEVQLGVKLPSPTEITGATPAPPTTLPGGQV